MSELADERDLGSRAERRAGSSPAFPTPDAHQASGPKRKTMDFGASIWLVVFLVALLFVVLWAILFAFLAFGTWFIAKTRISDDSDRPPQDY